jgi:energy-coupling factor transport system ATP-binding protein
LSAAGEPLVSVNLRRVSYGGGRDALRDVVLEVDRGEILGVVGHVGSGKTTLALAAAGLLGRGVPARIEGEIVHPSGAHPAAAFVFANPWTQLTELGGTVEEEVAVGPENQALPTGQIRSRVDTALDTVGIPMLAHRAPYQLSGGEVQRVALASALALDTPLLVLDEPTSQLDPDSSRGFADLLRSLAAGGKGIVLVEQDLELVRQVASRVLVLADGSPIAAGSPREVLDRWPPLDARLGAPPHLEPPNEDDRASPPPRGGAALLRVRDLIAGYDDREVLHGVTLDLPHGTAMAWLGRNGAGKTTLARTIMGLAAHRAGTIEVDGVSIGSLPVEMRARYVGMVFQDPGRQLFSRTLLEEALFGPRALGRQSAEADRSAREALTLVGLERREHAHPGDLSPQSQRLLAIASALASGPRLLILDEPTAGQDAAGRAHIARAIAYQRQRGAAAIITHDRHFASRVCDAAVTLDGGRLVYR